MKVGEFVADRKFDGLFLFGEMSGYYADGAERTGMPGDIIHIFHSKDELAAHLRGILVTGDVVLVKGSRSMKMEDVVNSIVK
jgi:UDP-N-acetylmuramoyl-tripeptide--D-alanyl-D-alanine ligase